MTIDQQILKLNEEAKGLALNLYNLDIRRDEITGRLEQISWAINTLNEQKNEKNNPTNTDKP